MKENTEAFLLVLAVIGSFTVCFVMAQLSSCAQIENLKWVEQYKLEQLKK